MQNNDETHSNAMKMSKTTTEGKKKEKETQQRKEQNHAKRQWRTKAETDTQKRGSN